ncbi:MAG: putative penicillin-binding protein [Candidatus Woesebacteria bacterium GW2011_GWF1_31_35]|nr:MAG: putative penicillin-binding protein [Candidatus Woesebacteria bacterium GW2011_GWF1_31_35]
MAGKIKKTTTAFSLLTKILIVVGKPFYFCLTHILIATIFIFYAIGRIINLTFKIKLKPIKISIPKVSVKLPKFKIKKRLLLPFIFLLVFSFTFYFLVLKGLPSPRDLITREQSVSTKIYDRNGELLYTIYKDKNRTPVTLSQIPENTRLATLAAEDAEFYQHPGFSIRGIIRASIKNLKEGKLNGGSTITQQLVKNALLSSEKTYVRKLRELILSIGVELNFSKDQILEMYLNEVSYGGTAYGIQEAARLYFGKDVGSLTLSESALLAGLPQSPTRYSPFGPNPDLTFSRQREVLHLMRVNKFITSEEEEVFLSERITFAPNKTDIKAPHFVMYVREKLIDEYGEEMVLKGGLIVTTTLDLKIQEMAEKVVKEELEKLKNLNVGNAAVLVVDPKNGEVLAMVGSKDYFDTKNGGNVNVTTRLRQPGSSIKVINYALSLSNSLTLASTIDDSPITFSVSGLPPYTPKNYDGTYRGKISVRSALAESRNIPAVKILASYGVSKMIDLGEKMGITTWTDRSRFGLSLTLGGGEVKLVDLAQVYSVIANMGVKNEIKVITEVKNYKENLLSQKESRFNVEDLKVLDPRVAFLLIDVLKDNIARSPSFGLNSMLVIPNHPEVAVKTGTSNDLKDNLTIGFNKDYLVAVWVGNNDGTPMSRIASGITGAAPIWNKITRSLLNNKDSVNWIPPEGLIKKECFSRMEWFLEEKQLSCPKILEPAPSTTNE